MKPPTKIYELKDQDWMKGLSIQTDSPYGGIFQSAINFDPFERMGYFQATLASTVVDATTITTRVNHFAMDLNPFGYAFALGDRAATSAKCLYQIKLSDLTVTDISTWIDTNNNIQKPHGGLIIYGGIGETRRLVYEQSGTLRSVKLDGTTDTNILTSALTQSTYPNPYPTDFCVGSDLNLYYTAYNGFSIGKIVTIASTSGNTSTALQLQSGIVPRSLASNGYYIIAIGDNNDGKANNGADPQVGVNAKCKVYFWDKVKSTADVVWDIPDDYLIGVRFVNGRILIMGYQGIWECNLSTPPKLVLPIANKLILPTSVNQMGVQNTNLVWTSTSTGSRVYSYGSLIGKPILFDPYQSSGSSDLQTAIGVTGSQILTATDNPSVYELNTGSTRSNATAVTATQDFDQPFMLSFAKVVLRSPLSSGQTVILSLFDSAGNVVMDTSTKTYTALGAKKDLIFQPTGTSTVKRFDDLYLSLTVNGGAVVKRVAVYATPIGDDSQALG